MAQLTPMMQQYMKMKEQHPDALLFFQLGDFYETFFEDAKVAARELDIVLTKRDDMPMAGVPIKKAEVYINRLLKRGIKVAVCDQVSDPKAAKGLVQREVRRVVTPGTVMEADVLEQATNNFLVAVCQQKKSWALAVCDVSTGEFRASSFDAAHKLMSELAKLSPAELLLPQNLLLDLPHELAQVATTEVSARSFAGQPLLNHFGIASPKALGLSELEAKAAGGLLSYLLKTQTTLAHLMRPRPYQTTTTLRLDAFTVRNLELVNALHDGGSQATLLGVINQALTGMGQRLLRHWLLNPLLDQTEIGARLDAVEALVQQGLLRAALRQTLAEVHDIERLVGRLGSGRVTPRDLLALQQSLAQLPDLWLKLKDLQDAQPVDALNQLIDNFENLTLRELADFMQRALREDAPLTLKDGGVIRPEFHPELGLLLNQEQAARQAILDLENSEKNATGIQTLKVGYNNVFGYFLEISKGQAKNAPPHYHRKQTLTNAERFITPELKTLEEKILAAQERARDLEYQLFTEVRGEVASHIHDLQVLADAIASLDVFAALAEVAQHHDYVRPTFSPHTLAIEQGRHPVVERLVKGQSYVPNNLELSASDKLVVLTGPNMSGKSTYLRQTALIALLAQMGSFVPATRAELPVFDQIFTRVGASDMLAGGYSTFMVEMLETANILNNATENSLVLLDEMGRGTSTFDGVSIAWAVAEHLVKKLQSKTLFATHYHELTQLSEQIEGVLNLHVRVKEHQGDVIFLHQVARGAAEGSYGVHVAKLAGLPKGVVSEAESLLERILSANPLEGMDNGAAKRGPRVVQQLALFNADDHPVIQTLSNVDVNALTPIQALELLAQLKQQL